MGNYFANMAAYSPCVAEMDITWERLLPAAPPTYRAYVTGYVDCGSYLGSSVAVTCYLTLNNAFGKQVDYTIPTDADPCHTGPVTTGAPVVAGTPLEAHFGVSLDTLAPHWWRYSTSFCTKTSNVTAICNNTSLIEAGVNETVYFE